MSNYHPEVELNSPMLCISLYPDNGVQLQSMNITRKGGKPKSKQAIIVELRVCPLNHLAPAPIHVNIPWKKGDPTKVEVKVTEIYETGKIRPAILSRLLRMDSPEVGAWELEMVKTIPPTPNRS